MSSYREMMLEDSLLYLRKNLSKFLREVWLLSSSVLPVLRSVRNNIESLSLSRPSSKTSKIRGRTIAIFIWTSDFGVKVWSCKSKYGRKLLTLVCIQFNYFPILHLASSVVLDKLIISVTRTNQISVCSLETSGI